MEFNPYSIAPIISLVAIFTIGFLAYRYNPSSHINKSFFYLCLCLCFWLFNFSMMYNSKSDITAFFWAKFGFLGVIFIALLAYNFVHQLLLIKPIFNFNILLVLTILSTIPPLSDLFLNTKLVYIGIKKEFFGYYPIAGKIYFIYIVFFAIVTFLYIFTLFVHMQKLKQTKEIYKYNETKYVFFACLIASTGVVDFIAKYVHSLYPFGWLTTLVFISIICYAIIKHQLQENELLRKEVMQSEKFKAIATLASGMAHEIKNPLTPIKTFSEQLPSKIDDKEFLLKFSKIINKEVDRIDNLVQELLGFAKPSAPHLKPSNICRLIEQTMEFLNNEILRHKIIINTLFENKNVLINIDSQQIKQALLNIFLNAIDAMPNGGTLNINVLARSEATKALMPGTRNSSQSLIIEIADTGCGIAPKDLPHIFDPFFTKKDHGTGLGLSITHEIIKNHRGKILVESNLGKGTVFRIELPLAEAE